MVVLIVLGLRLATAAPDSGGVSADTGNYMLSLQTFSPDLHRPHPPGSWLLVVLLRGLAYWLGPHGAVLALSIMCSAAAAGLAHALFRRWFAAVDAWLLSVFLATMPLVWFYGTVPEIYAFDMFFGALVVRVGLMRRGLIWLPLVFAVGASLRLTTPVLLAPLYIWLWRRGFRDGHASRRMFWQSHLAAAAVLAIGLGPLIAFSGGPVRYLEMICARTTIDWTLSRNVWEMSLFVHTLAAALVPLAAVCFLFYRERSAVLDRDTRVTLWIWLLPAGLFFTFGHYQKGYALLVVVPLIVLLVAGMAARRLRPLLAFLSILQIVFFLGMPYVQPPVQVLQAPHTRSAGRAEVWLSRARSTHLMAAAMPRALAAVQAELGDILAAAPDNTILADPTVPLSLRAMQVTHPRRAIAVLELFRADGWRMHAGLEERTGEGVADLIAGSVVVTRTDFARLRLADLSVAWMYSSGSLTALRIAPDDAGIAASRYAELFERTGQENR